ncbi:MAG: helix-turn-helix transcriptional regulator [Cyclobacteriaceae bacterium]|nr:helix-turn-helix transcriptional regulator [Cyclobacteriaceae bacterium]
MPDFIYDRKIYYNPVEFALAFIGGTWKMPILWRLNQKTMRYGELKKTLPHITHKMLSSQLRELEKHELITREVFPVVPPKVEYTITKKGKEVIPLIEAIRNYGLKVMKEKGIKESESGKVTGVKSKVK